jgi:hypothetical protein
LECAAIYGNALLFIQEIHDEFLRANKNVDLEVSVDETDEATKPQAHFFLAHELGKRNIPFVSIAPRFPGSMEKGIDYMGDLALFRSEYRVHEQIAKHFGYKLSIHSGSDKFSIFPVIKEYSKAFHIKVSGTNWLVAVRLIARNDPMLFREMYTFSRERLDITTSNYRVSKIVPELLPKIAEIADLSLPTLLDRDDVRQMMHIAYGEILNKREDDGSYGFRDGLFAVLRKNEEEYLTRLQLHIGRHLECLGLLQ